MPKIAVVIEYDSPDGPLWLNPDNVALALHAHCENTKFKVEWAEGGNPWVEVPKNELHPHPKTCPKCGDDEVYYERFTEHSGGTYACHNGDCGWIMPAQINSKAMDCQEKSIELINKFLEIEGQRREELCAAFSEAIEWGRNDQFARLERFGT